MYQLKDYPLWTALITPMHADGKVDLESLTRLIQEQSDAQNGILILGSTGEALNLAKAEQLEILEHALKVKRQVPMMAGIGGINLPETTEWLAHLETLALDAYLLVTPLYAKPGPKGQEHWFRTLLDRATRPCMIYNIPGRTGKALEHSTVRSLASHPRFYAIKEASGSTQEFAQYVKDVAGHPIGVYAGDDGLLPHFFPLGCQGLVSVASNPWPREMHAWVKKVLRDGASMTEVKLFEDACQTLFQASNPIPAKVLMAALKRIKTPTLRPPLTALEMDNASAQLAAHEKVQQWMKTNSERK